MKAGIGPSGKLLFFLKNGPLFVYFGSFHIPIQMTNIQFEKSIDGVLGTRSGAAGWKGLTNPLSYGGPTAFTSLSVYVRAT